MKIAELVIKILAVLLMTAASACAYGRELAINAFAENKMNKDVILSESIKREVTPISEVENKVVQRNKNAVVAGDHSKFPFLVKSIKYNCLCGNGVAVLYNSNQKMIYDLQQEICIEFRYDCSIGEPKLSNEECIAWIRRAVYKAFSQKGIRISKVLTAFSEDKTFTAKVKIDGGLDEWMIISVRRDTGSVIYFKILDEQVE